MIEHKFSFEQKFAASCGFEIGMAILSYYILFTLPKWADSTVYMYQSAISALFTVSFIIYIGVIIELENWYFSILTFMSELLSFLAFVGQLLSLAYMMDLENIYHAPMFIDDTVLWIIFYVVFFIKIIWTI